MMSGKTFKKVQVVKISADFREAIEVVEVPLDGPKPGQVLVQNKFAGVNASDINFTAARYFTDGKVPFDIGFEGLGVVEAVGEGVTTFTVGQSVLYFGRQGYSEYLYAVPKELIPVPELKPELIATLVCGLTASIGLDQAGRIKPGDKVLITAAAGGTGQTCVQWAKSKGCYVIGTTSSDEKGAYLKSIGCDKVINYRNEDLDGALTRDFPDGVDVIWETIGGKTLEMLVQHLSLKGRLVIIGGITGYKTVGFPQVSFNNLPGQMVTKSWCLNGFLLSHYADLFAEYLPKIIGLIMVGTLKIKLDNGESTEGGIFKGIQSAVRAVEHLHSGKNTGKVVVEM